MIRSILKKLSEYALAIRNLMLDGFVCLIVRSQRATQGKLSILVVRVDAIGDFILWLDSAAELRRFYPAERFDLVLVGNSLWGELVPATGLFDEYVPLERARFQKDIFYRLNVMISLRRRTWAAAIHPTYSRESLFGDALIRVCGAPERIGSQGDCSNQSAFVRRFTNRWYTSLLPTGENFLMELERNAEFMRALGRSDFRASLPIFNIQRLLPPEFSAPDYFVVVPGANAPMRRWPIENFAAVAERIRQYSGYSVVVCGAPGERSLGIRLGNLMREGVSDYTGRTGLSGYASIIKEARFLIGNESSAIHVAAAVGTPAFCIAGGGHYGRFVPYRLEKVTASPMPVVITQRMDCFGCGWECVRSMTEHDSWPCISRITVDDVWERVSEFLRDKNF